MKIFVRGQPDLCLEFEGQTKKFFNSQLSTPDIN